MCFLCIPAPAAFFLEMQGIVGCIDPVLLDWLTYVPTVSMQRVSSNRGKVIVVDATLADATSPLQNKGGTDVCISLAGLGNWGARFKLIWLLYILDTLDIYTWSFIFPLCLCRLIVHRTTRVNLHVHYLVTLSSRVRTMATSATALLRVVHSLASHLVLSDGVNMTIDNISKICSTKTRLSKSVFKTRFTSYHTSLMFY